MMNDQILKYVKYVATIDEVTDGSIMAHRKYMGRATDTAVACLSECLNEFE
jgi:hypothetical protein